ncbi:hypothetical protein COLO4_33749 [Corchorus olitorius]|uniref:Uncharacterized protein n=1 Tax=Corchorus olitorius TaxID=93759 RepID=A0A1R3GRL7_9ROSI|nr:hypothetical protein COLO4_33749 [Corchorus olitorius]
MRPGGFELQLRRSDAPMRWLAGRRDIRRLKVAARREKQDGV